MYSKNSSRGPVRDLHPSQNYDGVGDADALQIHLIVLLLPHFLFFVTFHNGTYVDRKKWFNHLILLWKISRSSQFSTEINPNSNKDHEPMVLILFRDTMKIYESLVISGNLTLLLWQVFSICHYYH